jgi:hypothetical protein
MSLLARLGCGGTGRAIPLCPAGQTSTCSALARVVDLNAEIARRALNLLCYNKRCTARKLPVRRYMSVALVRCSECVPKRLGSSPMRAIHWQTSRGMGPLMALNGPAVVLAEGLLTEALLMHAHGAPDRRP